MPCVNALPPQPIRPLFEGDDEDWAHYLMVRIDAYFIRRHHQAFHTPMYKLVLPQTRKVYLDFREVWPNIGVHNIRVPKEAYTDFTALRLERARLIAQRFENYMNTCLKVWF